MILKIDSKIQTIKVNANFNLIYKLLLHHNVQIKISKLLMDLAKLKEEFVKTILVYNKDRLLICLFCLIARGITVLIILKALLDYHLKMIVLVL